MRVNKNKLRGDDKKIRYLFEFTYLNFLPTNQPLNRQITTKRYIGIPYRLGSTHIILVDGR